MIRSMVTVISHGLMEEAIKDNGKMENSMAKESTKEPVDN